MSTHAQTTVNEQLQADALSIARRELASAEHGTALSRLDHVNDAARHIAALEHELVRAAREDGQSWAAIGAALGTSKQAAQQRFGGAHVSAG